MSNEVTVAIVALVGTLITVIGGIIVTRNKPGITPPTPSSTATGNDGGWVNVGASMLKLSEVVARHSTEREEDRREMDLVKQHLNWWQGRANQLENWGIWATGDVPRTPPSPVGHPPGLPTNPAS